MLPKVRLRTFALSNPQLKCHLFAAIYLISGETDIHSEAFQVSRLVSITSYVVGIDAVVYGVTANLSPLGAAS